MWRNVALTLTAACLVLVCGVQVASAGSSLGAGIHYLRTVGDIKDQPDWDSNAVGFLGSYQLSFPLVKIEGDLEWVPNFGGSDKSLFQPQAYGLIGGLIYGGLGIGTGRFDGDWLDAFYALRAGVSLGLAGIAVDGFLSYTFQSSKFSDFVDEVSLDQFTLGAIARFGF
jgi:hypothetical protein